MRRRIASTMVRALGIDRSESLIGALLVAAGAARMHRDRIDTDDTHEVRHLYAALKAGDSTDCDVGSCVLSSAWGTGVGGSYWYQPADIRSGFVSSTGALAPCDCSICTGTRSVDWPTHLVES